MSIKIFNVSVTTGSSKPCVEFLNDNHLKIFVSKRPIDGEANEAVISSVADFFEVSKTMVSIKSGKRNKNKVVEVIL